MIHDALFGLRRVIRAPVQLVLTTAILGLALSATGTAVVLVNALLLTPLRVLSPQSLALITVHDPRDVQGFVSLNALQQLARQQDVFLGLCGTTGVTTARVLVNTSVMTVTRESVTGECPSVLGARTVLGRTISEQDLLQVNPVVVLSYRFWQRELGGDHTVIGRILTIEGIPVTVVGVMPADFSSIGVEQAPDLTLPLSLMGRMLNTPIALRAYYMIGRLRPGVTLQAAQARLVTLWPRILASSAGGADPVGMLYMRDENRVHVESGAYGISILRKRYAEPLVILLYLGLAVLASAAVNIGGLMLSRAIGRERDWATWMALGAPRSAIIWQIVAEATILALAGTAAALPLTLWCAEALTKFVWTGQTDVTLKLFEPRALLYVGTVTLMTALLVALPEIVFLRLVTSRPHLVSNRTVVTTARLAKIPAGIQCALCLALLSVAGLLVSHLRELKSIDPGYAADGLYFARLIPIPGETPKIDFGAYQRTLLDRVSRLPGVSGAALSNWFPLATVDRMPLTTVSPAPSPVLERSTSALSEVVSPDFFGVAEIGLIKGRTFTFDDDMRHPGVALVNSTLARQLGGVESSMGLRIRSGAASGSPLVEIVGVVADASPGDPRISHLPILYRPIFQQPSNLINPVVTARTSDPKEFDRGLRESLQSLGHSYIVAVQSVNDRTGQQLIPERMLVLVSSLIGAFVLVLSIVGLYATITFNLERRLREFGLRLALGASGRVLVLMILREGASVAAIGALAGIPVAVAGAKLVRSFVSDVSVGRLAPALTGALCMMIVATFVALLVPAQRAMRTDPASALRLE